jgi:PAS domain S-box-containing protein
MSDPVVPQTSRLSPLSETEALALVTAVHHVPIGILILGSKGEIDYVNPRFDELTGLHLEVHLHETISSACEGHNQLICDMLNGAVQFTRRWQGEVEIARPDGSKFWVHISISPVVADDGSTSNFAVICQDISETRELLMELKWSERRYRDIFESVGVAIWEQDFAAVRSWIVAMQRQGVTDFLTYFENHPGERAVLAGMVKILDVNDYSVELFGARKKSELLGMLDQHCFPETLDAVPPLIQTLAEGGDHFETETVLQTVSGFRLHVAIAMSFPKHMDPYERVLMTIFDISRRIRAEEETQHMRRFLFSMVDNIPLMVFVKDARDFKMAFWNKYSEELTGLSRLNMIGKTDFDVWPEDQAAFFRAADEQAVKEGKVVEIIQEPITDVNGNLRILHTRKTVLWNEVGEPEYLLGISEDITDRIKAENERHDLEREIVQSRQMEAVGSLAAGIAHEINTPIQFVGDNVRFLAESIDTMLSMGPAIYEIIDTCESAEQKKLWREKLLALEAAKDLDYMREEVPKAIEQTLEGVHRVATIVRAMKDFAHTSVTDRNSADVNRMLESTLIVARNEYKYVADVHTEFAEDLPLVDCIQSELNQVWLNLIVNASHAIAEKVGESGAKGLLTVCTRQEDDQIVVEIADTGCGIPDEIHDRVWDHFFTTKQVGKGTGQGLSIVHAIIDKHDGAISFESRANGGTTFTVRLPLQSSQAGLLEDDDDDLA